MFRVMAAIGVLVLSAGHYTKSSPTAEVMVDLHPYGFAIDEPPRAKVGIFYMSRDRLAVFFNDKVPASGQQSHAFQLLVLNTDGRVLARREIQADPKAMDITPGPNGGVLYGRAGHLDLFDADLQLLKTVALPESVTGISFDRKLNQLVEMTIDDVSQTRSAHFLDGSTLQEQLTLNFPIKSVPVFGEKQLAYTLGGNCFGSTHVMSGEGNWTSLSDIPACSLLTFVGNDEIAYPFDKQLYILDRSGKQLFKARIPAPNTFVAPSFVGISDNHMRLAVEAVEKTAFAKHGYWPYYNEVFVYDLKTKRTILRHALPIGCWVRPALSPDGHQFAVVEQGVVKLIPIS
ncbi:MAG: hypothetical protein WCA15_12520 [Candidatus Acidiferrales bacterium]